MRRKKNNMQKRARRIIKGIHLSWIDCEPEKNEINLGLEVTVSHKNSLKRPMATEIFATYGKYIRSEQPFFWYVKTTTVFIYDNGIDQYEVSEFRAFIVLDDLNEVVAKQLAEDRRHGGKFSHVIFYVECVDVHNRLIEREAS